MVAPTFIAQGIKFEPKYLAGLKGFSYVRGRYASYSLIPNIPEWFYAPHVDIYNWHSQDLQEINNSTTGEQDNATINNTAGDQSHCWAQGYKTGSYSSGKWQVDRGHARVCNGDQMAYGYARIMWNEDTNITWNSAVIRAHCYVKVPPINCKLTIYLDFAQSGDSISWGSGPNHTHYIKIDGTSIETSQGTYTLNCKWISPTYLDINGTVYNVTDGILEVKAETTGNVTLNDAYVQNTAYVNFVQENPPDVVDIPVNP